MLAIAPHKRGAIFLSTVDGSASYAQNSPKQGVSAFEERTDEGSFEFEKIANKRPANQAYSDQPLASPERCDQARCSRKCNYTNRKVSVLYILTGDVQIGKTRWLQALVSDLEARGAVCDGVIAPGVWCEDEAGGFDKLGIDNELLPTHEVVHFARRDDLARAEGTFDANAQSAKAMLRWHISDEAIRKVNAHFDALIQAAEVLQTIDMSECARLHADPAKRMLIVDELGCLELLRNEGLTSAMELLKRGPEECYECALLVARDMFDLPHRAEMRFAAAWGGSKRISPTDEARDEIVASVLGR